MNVSISKDLSIGDVAMSALSVQALRRAFGKPDSEEKIALYGGGVRLREVWTTGVSTLRDDEEEAICLFINPAAVRVLVADKELPDLEREFVKRFPHAQKGLGRSYTLVVENWRLDLDFTRSLKRRGAGSTIRHLSRVIVGSKKPEPNQSSQRNAMAELISVFESRSSRG